MGGKLPTQTYHDIEKKRATSEILRQKLKLINLEAKARLSAKHPHVEKYFSERGIELGKIREHSARILGAGAITGALLLSPPDGSKALPAPQDIIQKLKTGQKSIAINIPQKELVDAISSQLPEKTRALTYQEEKYLEQTFSNIIGINAKANLEGEHLNTTYGLIGAEQHLMRYPGDSLTQHRFGDNLKEGMAPGRGAWGYFASSKDKLTPDLVEIERWYAVVQTLYLPDWSRRQPYLKDWYKYRKVLIVNTKNGNAVVASIADSGPAAWTGKHFGGSPEVMQYLGGKRYKKGPVIIFFVDDPENEIPLGPVDYNSINLPELAFHYV